MTLTVQYLRTSVLSLCYSDDELQELIDRVPSEGIVPVLLSLPPGDARRVLAGLLSSESRIVWAKACAARAKAANAATRDAVYAADHAANAATLTADAAYANAAHAAAYAAAYAADAAHAEHEKAVRHAVELLGWLV